MSVAGDVELALGGDGIGGGGGPGDRAAQRFDRVELSGVVGEIDAQCRGGLIASGGLSGSIEGSGMGIGALLIGSWMVVMSVERDSPS